MIKYSIKSRSIEYSIDKVISSEVLRNITSGSKKQEDGIYVKEDIIINISGMAVKITGLEFNKLRVLGKRIESMISSYDKAVFYETCFTLVVGTETLELVKLLGMPLFLQEKDAYSLMGISVAVPYKKSILFIDIKNMIDEISVSINSLLDSHSDLDDENDPDKKHISFLTDYIVRVMEEGVDDGRTKERK